jgi:hypothetical protein
VCTPACARVIDVETIETFWRDMSSFAFGMMVGNIQKDDDLLDEKLRFALEYAIANGNLTPDAKRPDGTFHDIIQFWHPSARTVNLIYSTSTMPGDFLTCTWSEEAKREEYFDAILS